MGQGVVILHGLRRWWDQRGELKGGGQRVSRHYYDVYRLLASEILRNQEMHRARDKCGSYEIIAVTAAVANAAKMWDVMAMRSKLYQAAKRLQLMAPQPCRIQLHAYYAFIARLVKRSFGLASTDHPLQKSEEASG